MKPRTLLAAVCGALLVLLGVVSYAYKDLAHETRQRERAAYASGVLEGMRARAAKDSTTLETCLNHNQSLRMALDVERQRAKIRADR